MGERAGCGPWCLLRPSGEHKSDTEVLRLAWESSHPLFHRLPLLFPPFLLCHQLIREQGQTLSHCHLSPPLPKLNVHAKPTQVFKRVHFPPEVVPTEIFMPGSVARLKLSLQVDLDNEKVFLVVYKAGAWWHFCLVVMECGTRLICLLELGIFCFLIIMYSTAY